MITEINGKKLDFHQLVENSPDGRMLIKDDIVLYANKSCLRLLKLSEANEILNQDIKKFIHPADYNIYVEGFEKVSVNGSSNTDFEEIRVIDGHGNIIDVAVLIDEFIFEDELLAQLLIKDITNKKETQKLLMQSDKLSVMGELAAGIVHEIRNPLTIIRGFLKIMGDGELLPKHKDYIHIMTSEVQRIEAIANDLLYFAKPHEIRFKQENIITIIKDVIFLLGTSALAKRIIINFIHNEDDVEVNCDGVQIKQSLINLIKNAIEATPPNGKINVKINKYKNKVLISISDTGCGIPKEKMNELGTSFFTTKKGGTGLGLMVTYNLIKNHNGKINVESKEQIGTTFEIQLPLL